MFNATYRFRTVDNLSFLKIVVSFSYGGIARGAYLAHGPLARYVKSQVEHAPGMLEMFSLPPQASDPDMHHGTCVTHVPWCMLGSLTSGFPWSRWWGKHSRHSRCMRNRKFYVSGKRPVDYNTIWATHINTWQLNYCYANSNTKDIIFDRIKII